MEPNFARMMRLIDETFATRTDPSQIQVDEGVIEHLTRLHPAALSEERNDDGPIAWVLIFPTTRSLMEDFVTGRISEKELLDKTPVSGAYQSVYLCSALVLEEFRRKGIAKRLMLNAIERMRHDHKIEALFDWIFTPEGEKLSASVARETGLSLAHRRK